MALIDELIYEEFPGHAGQMRTHAQELNSEIKNAYINVTNMHENWYGKRYNELASDFNKIIPMLKDILQLLVGEIPFELEKIANNYAIADKGERIVNPTETAYQTIEEIPMPNDVGMRCITAQVEEVQKTVSTNFRNAIDKMEIIDNDFSKVVWQSEAGTKYRNKVKEAKKDVIDAFENLENQFSRLMNQAVEDINAAEKSNTVS